MDTNLRQILTEAATSGTMDDQEDYLDKFLDMVRGMGKTISKHGKPLAKETMSASKNVLKTYAKYALKATPTIAAGEALKLADTAVAKTLNLPATTVKRMVDGISGMQKLRRELVTVSMEASSASESLGKKFDQKIAHIQAQLKANEITPGQSKNLLKELIKVTRREIENNLDNPRSPVNVTVNQAG